MIKQVAHICIGSQDLAKTEHFYCDVLGMKIRFEFKKGGKRIGYYLEAGGNTFIEVFAQGDAPNLEKPIIKHFCLEVEDIDAAMAGVKAKGWEIGDKKMGADHSWQCWITAPDGVRIEFHQYTDQSTQITGEDCIVDW